MIGGQVRHSIIRRSSAVAGAFLLGHALNYALMLVANRVLAGAGFGLFYTTMLIVTVAMAPLMAIVFALGRSLAEIAAADRKAVTQITLKALAAGVRFGLPTVFVAGFVLVAAQRALGIEAWSIAVMIPAVILVLSATEMLRTGYQSQLKFGWSSALWVSSQAVQFALATGLLVATGRVWPGILGIFLGAGLALVPFVRWFIRQGADGSPAGVSWPLNLRAELPLIVSYSLFVLINNMDILVAFWLLPHADLDTYAASALLPKAIVTATFPVAQIILPVIVERRAMGMLIRASLFKGLIMTMGMALVAVATVWTVLPLVQQSPMAIRGLDGATTRSLAAAALALSCGRLLVVAEIALQRFALVVVQAVAVAVFVVACALVPPSTRAIAAAYAAVAWGFFITAIAVFASNGAWRAKLRGTMPS